MTLVERRGRKKRRTTTLLEYVIHLFASHGQFMTKLIVSTFKICELATALEREQRDMYA